jgi:hypothetical protein
MDNALPRGLVMLDILDERAAQDAKWGEQNHPDGTGPGENNFRVLVADRYRQACEVAAREGRLTWRDIALEEVFEAMAEYDPAKLRAELVQAAAVLAAWIECIDRRQA